MGWVVNLLMKVVQPFCRGDESYDELMRKMVVVGKDVSTSVFWMPDLFLANRSSFQNACGIASVAIPVTELIMMKAGMVVTQTRFFIFVLLSTITLMLWEISGRNCNESWSIYVIVMDILLVGRCKSSHVLGTLGLVCAYILLVWFEQKYSFGLYALIPGSCTGGDADEFAWRLSVMLLDFTITRGFSQGMHRERARVMEGLDTAQAVAAALEMFNLEKARESVKDLGDGELREAFEGLIRNLQMYRPYLPLSLFDAAELPRDGTAECRAYPGHGKDEGDEVDVALVFTDIQSSTALWEYAPEGMSEALALHNEVMRDTIAVTNGYEVKTVGDSFMVAFDTVDDGLRFCIAAQEQLYKTEWPKGVMGHTLCAKEEGLWNGLRVRMGLNAGKAEVRINPLTGRADYFGTEVNRAARLEGVAIGGTAAVTKEVLEEVKGRLEEVGSPHIHLLGRYVLKGLAGEHEVYIVVPNLLRRRVVQTHNAVIPVAGREGDERSCVTNVRGFLRQGLHPSRGTVGHVRTAIRHSHDTVWSVNAMVELAADSADRTEGTLLSVCSTGMVVTWNAGKRCPTHPVQAARFAASIGHRVNVCDTAIGLATGKLMHGNVGTTRQRFSTIFSPCVELAGALSSAARSVRAVVLMVVLDGLDDPAVARHTRVVDTWHLPWQSVEVLEVHTPTFAGQKWGTVDDDADRGPGWTREVREALSRDDWKAIADIGDDTLQAVAAFRANGGHIPTPCVHKGDGEGWDDAMLASTEGTVITIGSV